MKFSRFYESVLILIIIFLFIRLVVTSGNLITLSQANIGFEKDPTNTSLQINHPELLIGPVEGNWTKDYEQLTELYQSTRVTTTNFCYNESEPLVPTGVLSTSLYLDGVQNKKPICYPVAIFKIQNGLMYIEGEIIN